MFSNQDSSLWFPSWGTVTLHCPSLPLQLLCSHPLVKCPTLPASVNVLEKVGVTENLSMKTNWFLWLPPHSLRHLDHLYIQHFIFAYFCLSWFIFRIEFQSMTALNFFTQGFWNLTVYSSSTWLSQIPKRSKKIYSKVFIRSHSLTDFPFTPCPCNACMSLLPCIKPLCL